MRFDQRLREKKKRIRAELRTAVYNYFQQEQPISTTTPFSLALLNWKIRKKDLTA